MTPRDRPVFLAIRPKDRIEATRAAFASLPIDLIFTSVIEYEAVPCRLPDPAGFDGLIVTSPRAVLHAPEGASLYAGLPVYAVGAGTARQLAAWGFQDVRHVAPDVEGLVAHLKALNSGRFLYVRGDEVSRELRAQGIQVEEVITYRSVPAPCLGPSVVAAIRNCEIKGVLFFSAASARVFTNLLNQEGLGQETGILSALCLSERVLQSLAPQHWASCVVAPQPDLDGMAAALSRGALL